jgi:hypothetical protein
MTPTSVRDIISTPKVMITIFWSPLGFPVIDALPAGENFTTQYLCDNIVPQVAEQRSSDGRQNTVENLLFTWTMQLFTDRN